MKISRKIQIREYSENFLHAKNTCYTVHRISKARFKLNLRKESLASKLANGDSKGFWKLIKGDSNVRVPLPTSVEGVTGEANIANLMRTHY